MPDYQKPLPYISEGTQPFWEGTRAHELRLPRCRDCGRFHFYPRSLCPQCLSSDLEWVRASGRGKVYSFTISHRPATPAFKEDVPYNIIIVELDEGPRMMSNLTGCANEDISIDMPVEAVFDDVTEEVTLPRFRPIAD